MHFQRAAEPDAVRIRQLVLQPRVDRPGAPHRRPALDPVNVRALLPRPLVLVREDRLVQVDGLLLLAVGLARKGVARLLLGRPHEALGVLPELLAQERDDGPRAEALRERHTLPRAAFRDLDAGHVGEVVALKDPRNPNIHRVTDDEHAGVLGALLRIDVESPLLATIALLGRTNDRLLGHLDLHAAEALVAVAHVEQPVGEREVVEDDAAPAGLLDEALGVVALDGSVVAASRQVGGALGRERLVPFVAVALARLPALLVTLLLAAVYRFVFWLPRRRRLLDGRERLVAKAAGLGVYGSDVEGSVGVSVVTVNAWWEVRHCLLFLQKLPFKYRRAFQVKRIAHFREPPMSLLRAEDVRAFETRVFVFPFVAPLKRDVSTQTSVNDSTNASTTTSRISNAANQNRERVSFAFDGIVCRGVHRTF